jgi:stage III sporulation protein SpoIIIAA
MCIAWCLTVRSCCNASVLCTDIKSLLICLLCCAVVQEAQAARTIAQRGVVLVGTAHGIELGGLLKNPDLVRLVGGVTAVTLGGAEAAANNNGKKVRVWDTLPAVCVMPKLVCLHLPAAGSGGTVLCLSHLQNAVLKAEPSRD